jgi:hypothetical protein
VSEKLVTETAGRVPAGASAVRCRREFMNSFRIAPRQE